jgi:hypothetical protein
VDESKLSVLCGSRFVRIIQLIREVRVSFSEFSITFLRENGDRDVAGRGCIYLKCIRIYFGWE